MLKEMKKKLDTLFEVNNDVEVVEEGKTEKLHLNDVLHAINGLWLSFSVSENNGQCRHLIDHKYYDGDTKGKEKIIAKWVLSPSFIKHGFDEPMNLLLFSGATKKDIIVVSRDCNIKIIRRKNSAVESVVEYVGKFAEIKSEIDDEINTKIHELLKSLIYYIEEKNNKINKQETEEIYNKISTTIRDLIEKTLKNIKSNSQVVEILWEKLGHESELSDELKRKINKTLIEACIWNRLTDDYKKKNCWKRIYYIPDTLSDKEFASGFVCATAEENKEVEDVNFLSLVCNRICGVYYYYSHLRDIRIASTKSAIGSIMSRNGSHNIGSHVLAALSHNVGTMPDDRVLYQYIQHRMDYIATATTEFPVWRQPTMLVSNIMRDFLRQKHLLDYISSSEGLHAYNFQGHLASRKQNNSIRIHVRRVERKDDWESNGFINNEVISDFISYSDDLDLLKDSKKVDFENDLAIAVPGGTVGNHAFFTILENILRNAAKHEWALAVKYWKQLEEDKNIIESLLRNIDEQKWKEAAECWLKLENKEDIEVVLHNASASELEKIQEHWGEKLNLIRNKLDECKPTNLDLYVDFADNPKQGVVECRIWTKIEIKNREYRNANLDEIKKLLEEKIEASFIDENTGRLKKENWGIAEMRISAGYLQGKSLADIGGLSSKGKVLEIIRPVIVNVGTADNCLGFRFDVHKPKELLVVIKDERHFEDEEILAKASEKAMQYGIAFKRETEVINGLPNPYSYVLFENYNLTDPTNVAKLKDAKLPYRLLGWNVQIGDKHEDIPLSLQKVASYGGDFFRKDGQDVLENNLNAIVDSKKNNTKIYYDLLEETYRFWLDKIYNDKYGNNRKELVLDLGRNGDKSGGQSLVSNYDLLKFVFIHSFGAAVMSFLSENNESEVSEGFAALLLAIASMPYRKLATTRELAARSFGKAETEVSSDDEKTLLLNDYAIVYHQIGIWSDLLKDSEKVKLNLKYVPKNWYSAFENREWLVKIDEWDKFSAENDQALGKFIDFILTVILNQAEAFLRKYEEEIATLPSGFSVQPNDSSFNWEWKAEKQKVIFTCDQGDKNNHYDKDFCYFRHEERQCQFSIDSYCEALSGAQSVFNVFDAFKNSVSLIDTIEKKYPKEEEDRIKQPNYLQNKNTAVRFMTSLVENAIFKFIIIDERVKKFMDDHQNVRENLNGLGIVVMDHNDIRVRKMFSDIDNKNLKEEIIISQDKNITQDKNKSGIPLGKFDVVIVHQGIVDKLLENHENKDFVKKWLITMESQIPYVVITTGRGTPANIPDEAKVLPYSVIESSILQRFPEKMILVDTIMNLLPIVKES